MKKHLLKIGQGLFVYLILTSCNNANPCDCKLRNYYSENKSNCDNSAQSTGIKEWNQKSSECQIDYVTKRDEQNGYTKEDAMVMLNENGEYVYVKVFLKE